MWYLATVGLPPRFITLDGQPPKEVAGVALGHHQPNTTTSHPTAITNGDRGIHLLYKAGVRGFPTKKAAREAAKAHNLTGFKYLQVVFKES